MAIFSSDATLILFSPLMLATLLLSAADGCH
jgi:hypothetical protein